MRKIHSEFTDVWYFSDEQASFILICLCSFISRGNPACRVSDFENRSIFDDFSERLNYIQVKFSLIEFLSFLGIQNVTQYQRTNYATFFKVLPHCTSIFRQFNNEEFISIIGFPSTVVFKENKRLQVMLTISKQFFQYSYPFADSSFFKVDTTSVYIKDMSESEIKERIKNI